MTGIELVLLVGALAAGAAAGVAGLGALVARSRRRRNRILPDQETEAPVEWAGAHTPLARLHRRLQAAARAARAVPDPDGSLIRARVEVEQAAVAVDDHLVALHRLAERERAARMAQATAAVASVEEAAARLADAASASRSTALPAVEEALRRADLVAEARRELDEDDPTVILGEMQQDVPSEAPGDQRGDEGDEPRRQPSTG